MGCGSGRAKGGFAPAWKGRPRAWRPPYGLRWNGLARAEALRHGKIKIRKTNLEYPLESIGYKIQYNLGKEAGIYLWNRQSRVHSWRKSVWVATALWTAEEVPTNLTPAGHRVPLHELKLTHYAKM